MPFVLADRPAAIAETKPQTPALTFAPEDGGPGLPLVTRDETGAWHAHIDLDACIRFILAERYVRPYRPAYTFVPGVARLVPTALKARILARLIRREEHELAEHGGPCPAFPAWPKDRSVDALSEIASIVRGAPPAAPAWPENKKYAVVFTHDVDSSWIFHPTERAAEFLRIETAARVKSAWYFVVGHLPKGERLTHDLARNGHEIGFHCYNHDHRFPFLSRRAMARRMARCAAFLERHAVKGLRSANYLKTERFLHFVAPFFCYDLTFHDSSAGPGGRRGCSTVRPFIIPTTSLLEIPTTVPEDYLLLMRGLSPRHALEIQLAAIEDIKARGGVVNIVTHAEPRLSVNPDGLYLYRELVHSVSSDPTAWIALPRDVATWCLQRIASAPTPSASPAPYTAAPLTQTER